MKFIPGLLLIAAAFLMVALIARAADYEARTQEPPTISELEDRILQLDHARQMCVEYVRGSYKARYLDEHLMPRERPEG